jgi:hypothetical protein
VIDRSRELSMELRSGASAERDRVLSQLEILNHRADGDLKTGAEIVQPGDLLSVAHAADEQCDDEHADFQREDGGDKTA